MLYDDLLKNFGLRLKFIRMKKSISQAQLAELIDAHEHNISDIERGKRNLTMKTINKIANALEVDIARFFDFKD